MNPTSFRPPLRPDCGALQVIPAAVRVAGSGVGEWRVCRSRWNAQTVQVNRMAVQKSGCGKLPDAFHYRPLFQRIAIITVADDARGSSLQTRGPIRDQSQRLGCGALRNRSK
jgi:hypothetical protein